MEKRIKQAELKEILNTYSIRKDEFEPAGNIGYCYMSKVVKGYMITISEDEHWGDKTERIIVSHTRGNGRRTYTDIWERDKDGKLEFAFRNLQNQPLSDADYIKDLEREIDSLKQAGRELQKQFQNQKLITDTTEPAKEQQPERQKPGDNERGAGRKPSPERLEAIDQMRSLLKAGASEQDIMSQLGISRATFYRYRRSINN